MLSNLLIWTNMSGKWHIYVHLEIIYWNANELIIKGQARSNIEGKQQPFKMDFLLWISAYLKECSKVHISLKCKKTDKIGLCISWPFKGDVLKVTGIGSKQGTSTTEGFFFNFPCDHFISCNTWILWGYLYHSWPTSFWQWLNLRFTWD